MISSAFPQHSLIALVQVLDLGVGLSASAVACPQFGVKAECCSQRLVDGLVQLGFVLGQ